MKIKRIHHQQTCTVRNIEETYSNIIEVAYNKATANTRETESMSSKVRNKRRLSVLTTLPQNCVRTSRRKVKRKDADIKDKIKSCLFTGTMILHPEYPKHSSKELLK